jgi:hypothetical protein
MSKVMQYFYKNHWYDENTGPFSGIKHTTYVENPTVELQWREKPMNEIKDPTKAEFPTDGCRTIPTRRDGDKNGFVQLLTDQGWELYHWSQVSDNQPWRHTLHWEGPGTDEDVLADATLALKQLRYVACVPSPTNQSDLDCIEEALERFRSKL